MIGEVWQSACDVVKELRRYLLAAIPPLGVNVSSAAGFTLQEWVYIVTLVYTSMLTLLLLPRFWGCGRCLLKHRACTMICKKDGAV